MSQPLFLKPYFQEKIWGGRRLKEVYGYDFPVIDQDFRCQIRLVCAGSS